MTITSPEVDSAVSVARQASEHAARMSDGVELFYRAWLPDVPTRQALILIHRGHEHSGRWHETVDSLGLNDLPIFAWDARGHGRSPGERGAAPSLSRVVQDLDEFVRHIADHHGIAVEDMIVLGHSVGAVTVAAWVHDYAPTIRAMILATPAFRVKLYVPLAVPMLRLRQKLLGPGYIKSYVTARMLTHDAEQAARYNADPLISRQIAVNVLLDLFDTSTRLIEDAGAITVPTLIVTAGSDRVVQRSAQETFFRRLSSPIKRIELFPNFSHAVFHEAGRQALIDKVRAFILERFSSPAERPSLRDADQRGYTHDEYQRLQSPGNPVFALTKWGLNTVGRLSRGVQLGCRAGFDSGVTLDYVYENRPQGITPIGCLIDRSYLNSIGWRGIRQRRVHMERLLKETIERTHAAGQPVRLLDIASGPGRYVLQTIHELGHIPITAVLRDYKPENLDAARRLAGELGLSGVTITQGDAFDRDSLAAVSPRPTIAIVSGLYELFPANEPVLRSLRGLVDAVEPGGHLIYTNQPWHPQVEFIARVLTNREGQPWIMRRRTQAEMDELVRAAGFRKVCQLIDPWGIFSVSLARKDWA
jgi:alpha-beta hydrolase superfamily lysophospholipase/SAM-dependent methyltransferase